MTRLIREIHETGTPQSRKLPEHYIQAYFDDMDTLGVQRADIHPQGNRTYPRND